MTLQGMGDVPPWQWRQGLIPVVGCLPSHDPVEPESGNAGRFLSGLRRRGDGPDAPQVRVYGPPPVPDGVALASAVLLGAAHVKAGELIPERLLSPEEIQQMLHPPDAG